MNPRLAGSFAIGLSIAVLASGCVQHAERIRGDNNAHEVLTPQLPSTKVSTLLEPSAEPMAALSVASIDLALRLNPVLFPVMPPDSSIEAIFVQIDDVLIEVTTFTDGRSVLFLPRRQVNSLTIVRADGGYWISVKRATTLISAGTEIDGHTEIQPEAGWKIVPYRPDAAPPISLALSSIDGKYDEVGGFGTEAISFIPESPSDFNNFHELRPQEVQLVHMTEPGHLVQLDGEGLAENNWYWMDGP